MSAAAAAALALATAVRKARAAASALTVVTKHVAWAALAVATTIAVCWPLADRRLRLPHLHNPPRCVEGRCP